MTELEVALPDLEVPLPDLEVPLPDLEEEEVITQDSFGELAQSTGNFQIRLGSVFITASRCDEAPEVVLPKLKRLWEKYDLEFVLVVQEKHLDGGNHLHAIVKCKTKPQPKVQSRDVDNIFGKHVNVLKVKILPRAIEYLFKSGKPISWSKENLSTQELRETHTKRQNKGVFLAMAKKLKENPDLDMTEDDEDAAFFLQHGKKVLDFKAVLVEKNFKKFVIPESLPDETSLWDWQNDAVRILMRQNNRQIQWIYDVTGNNGKSHIMKYLNNHYGAYVVRGGKFSDIALAYQYQPIVVFDYTRTKESNVCYDIMEQFKDGQIFSPKFKSIVKKRADIKVIVLSNFRPILENLTYDRWILGRLVDKRVTYEVYQQFYQPKPVTALELLTDVL